MIVDDEKYYAMQRELAEAREDTERAMMVGRAAMDVRERLVRHALVKRVEGLIERARAGAGSWEWVGTTMTAYRDVLAVIEEATP